VIAAPAARRRSFSPRAVVACAIAALAMLASILSLTTWAATPMDIVTFVTMPIAFGGVGAFLTIRVPRNPIGPMLLFATIGFALLIGGGSWVIARAGVSGAPVEQPDAVIAGLIANLVFIPSLVLVLVGIPLVFPDGHLLSPRWRWVVVATGLAVVAADLKALLGQRELMESTILINPLYQPELAPALMALEAVATVAAVPMFALAVASLVLRYRRSDDIGRHQIRWLAAAASVAAVAFACSFFSPSDLRAIFEGVGILALNAIPVAIGIAIVRYRLYEIDRLISRGISYAIVSVLLVAAYSISVILLQGPLGGLVGEDTITVAVSTLIVASLFQPIRRRVQHVVDRRFDRARVDGERTIDAFGERLRDEVDIDALVRDLGLTIDQAVRPASQGLWLRNDVG